MSSVLIRIRITLNSCSNQIDEHLIKFNENNYRRIFVDDFCDALISAKLETEEFNPNLSRYLSVDDLKNVIFNLFQAGTDTTRQTLDWTFLIIASYPDIQHKLREEIGNVIGDDIPTNEYRISYNYVQSFIAEVLRFRPVAPIGLPRKFIFDTNIRGIKVPKGTTIIPLLQNALHDKNIWNDPEIFRPERLIIRFETNLIQELMTYSIRFQFDVVLVLEKS